MLLHLQWASYLLILNYLLTSFIEFKLFFKLSKKIHLYYNDLYMDVFKWSCFNDLYLPSIYNTAIDVEPEIFI